MRAGTNYVRVPPFDIAEYREMQRSIPGVEGLYRLLGAIGEACFPLSGRILPIGAGSGRELEALGGNGKAFSVLAVDSSTKMLAAAKACAATAGCLERTASLEGGGLRRLGGAGRPRSWSCIFGGALPCFSGLWSAARLCQAV